MNKKGFTLIELLAVIIILGILMIIAIPSVTKYISDSRKNAYVDTAKEIIAGARNLVNEGKLEMFDTDTTYYIDQECIGTENASKSPYGDFTKAYVVVTYNGKGYDYYWTSVDDAGQGISKITKLEKLDTDSIESDLTGNDIPDSLGIDGRSKYMIIDKEQTNCGKGVETGVTGDVSGETGTRLIIYPEGKTKSTVVLGDMITIGGEGFYVIKRDGNNLVLLTQYNLKVGNYYSYGTLAGVYSSSDPGFGLQSSECGFNSVEDNEGHHHNVSKCTISFSNNGYWYGNNGKPGSNYTGSYSYNDYPYVYDSNSNIYEHVERYKNHLISLGLKVKEARLLSIQELEELGCTYSSSTSNAGAFYCREPVPEFVYILSYWLGSAPTNGYVWRMTDVSNSGWVQSNYNHSCDIDSIYGVRPVIVI